jgi:hypothetical protein
MYLTIVRIAINSFEGDKIIGIVEIIIDTIILLNCHRQVYLRLG